jgi:predicted transcriptional regulator
MIKQLMKDKGVTLKEISKGTGLSQSTVNNTVCSYRKKHQKTILDFLNSKKVIKGIKNIEGDKRFQTLLMNGFSYWEAFRICK